MAHCPRDSQLRGLRWQQPALSAFLEQTPQPSWPGVWPGACPVRPAALCWPPALVVRAGRGRGCSCSLSRGRCLWFHKKDSFSLLLSPGNGRGGHRCLVLEVLVRSGCVCDGPPPPPCHTAEAQAPPAPLRAPPLAPVLAQEESSEVPSCSHPAALAGAQGWPQAGLWVAMSDTGCARSGDLRRPGLRGHLSPPAHGDAGAAG